MAGQYPKEVLAQTIDPAAYSTERYSSETRVKDEESKLRVGLHHGRGVAGIF